MPKKDDAEKRHALCPNCGQKSSVSEGSCEHCAAPLVEDSPSGEGDVERLMSVPGVGEAKAHLLLKAGYRNVNDLQNADLGELAGIKGIGDKLAAKILESARSQVNPENKELAHWLAGEDEGLSAWISGENHEEKEAVATTEPGLIHDDSLAKWLAGSEDSLDSWLDEPKIKRVSKPKKSVPEEMLEHGEEITQLRETLRQTLKQFETDGFNPQAVLEQLAHTKSEVEAERVHRKQLEEELENVKRGSIAVIKFIKKQQGAPADAENLADKLASEMAQKEDLELKVMELENQLSDLREKTEKGIAEMPVDAQILKRQEIELSQRMAQIDAYELQLKAKENTLQEGIMSYGRGPSDSEERIRELEESSAKERELNEQIHGLEAKLSRTEFDMKHLEEKAKISETKGSVLDPELMKRLEQAQSLERSFALREQEIEKLKEELRIRDDETKKLKEPLAYKEQEMIRREEDLMFRERLLEEELKRVSQQKASLMNTDELTTKQRLEELQGQITEKEEEIRNKEKYFSMKEDELRAREQGLITDEIEKREQDRLIELKQEKVKTGTTRLDDLLLGGAPFGSNMLIYGPPFTGKEVLMNSFIAEGLKKGIPAIWVITEKSPKEIRNEMMFVLSGYEEYESRGLVRYVDTYSRSMGDETEDPYTEYVEAPTDYESIQKALEKAAKGFKKDHEYYRMAFRSISTLIAYLDPNTAFRFLSPVAGRRKRDKAVSMYTIEKGVHGDQEIQMLGSLMDGMIEFKLENLNMFLSVKGICEVQSRAFIRYSFTKSGLNIGSFSLDHIR